MVPEPKITFVIATFCNFVSAIVQTPPKCIALYIGTKNNLINIRYLVTRTKGLGA